jgi:HKD family nuclease
MIRIITNERNSNLKKRLQELIPNSKEAKILVAYCNYPGIKELYETLRKLCNEDRLSREHIKILVGLYDTKDKFIQDFTNSVIKSIKIALENQELDGREIYEQIRFFIKLLEEKIIVIRKTWKPNHSETCQ